MRNRTTSRILATLLSTYMVVLLSACQSSADTLTEEIVKGVVTEQFTKQYHDYWVESVSVDFGPIQIAPKKKMTGVTGISEESVIHPVKVVVTIRQTAKNGEVSEKKRGESPDELFLFFQNDFGDWSFRTGSSS